MRNTIDIAVKAIAASLHVMRVIEVPDYGLTSYVCLCSCEYEHIPVTSKAEADAQVAAGCPIKLLDEQAAQRRARRVAAQAA